MCATEVTQKKKHYYIIIILPLALYITTHAHINPLPTIASVLTKQNAIYTVLTASIKALYKFLWPYGKFMMQRMRHWLVKS